MNPLEEIERADNRVGLRLGTIEILSVIGRGGQATVYRGFCLVSRQHKAVKILHDGVDARRLEAEFRVLSYINSAHVVRVFAYGYQPPHYVMELVEGTTLASFRGNQLEAIRVVRQLCDGLRELHTAGVIHRDINPANVMIDGDGRVKIVDLGIAKRLPHFRDLIGSATPPPLRIVTEEGIGTPGYTAPEVMAGQQPTKDADVYSVGALLHHLVTSQLFDPQVPKDLAQVIAGATASAADRYDLETLAVALDELIACRTVESKRAATPVPIVRGPSTSSRRINPWYVLLATCAVTLVINQLLYPQSNQIAVETWTAPDNDDTEISSYVVRGDTRTVVDERRSVDIAETPRKRARKSYSPPRKSKRSKRSASFERKLRALVKLCAGTFPVRYRVDQGNVALDFSGATVEPAISRCITQSVSVPAGKFSGEIR